MVKAMIIFALVPMIASQVNAGDDFCPSGQWQCAQICASQEANCNQACYSTTPGAYHGWTDAEQACLTKCDVKYESCKDNCQVMWGCYEAQ